jgi:hypothetical protein
VVGSAADRAFHNQELPWRVSPRTSAPSAFAVHGRGIWERLALGVDLGVPPPPPPGPPLPRSPWSYRPCSSSMHAPQSPPAKRHFASSIGPLPEGSGRRPDSSLAIPTACSSDLDTRTHQYSGTRPIPATTAWPARRTCLPRPAKTTAPSTRPGSPETARTRDRLVAPEKCG